MQAGNNGTKMFSSDSTMSKNSVDSGVALRGDRISPERVGPFGAVETTDENELSNGKDEARK